MGRRGNDPGGPTIDGEIYSFKWTPNVNARPVSTRVQQLLRKPSMCAEGLVGQVQRFEIDVEVPVDIIAPC